MVRTLGTLTIDVIAEVGGFVSGMDKSERATERWRKSVEKSARAVGTVLGTTIAASVAGITAATVATVKNAAEVQKLAQISNSSTKEFQRYAAAASTLGIQQDKLGDIFKDVNDKVGDFLLTGGGELANFFKTIAPQVGVTADQFRQLSGPQALQLYIDSLQKAGLGQNQMITSLEAIANDASVLFPLFQDGGRRAKELGDYAERMGAIFSDKASPAFADLALDTAKLKIAAEGLRTSAIEPLIPAVSDLLDIFKNEDNVKGLKSVADGIGEVGKAAIDATAAIVELTGKYTGWLRSKGFLPVNGDSSVADLAARQQALQGSLDNWRGVFGDGTKEKIQAEMKQVAQWITEAQARIPKVTLLENGALPEAALKPVTRTPTSFVAPSASKAASEVDQLAKAYEAASLSFQREIVLFDTSADRSAQATELQKLNFELANGSLKGLNAAQQERLRGLATELDRLGALQDTNEKAAKAAEDYAKLKDELNRKDSDGLDLARERLKTLQAAAAAGAANDADYAKTAGKVIDQVGSQGLLGGYTGPDALYGGASGELDKIDKATKAENDRYTAQLEALAANRAARADLQEDWNAKELELAEKHQENLDNLDKSRNQVMLTTAAQGLGSVTDIMKTTFGEQSDLYKAAFAIQKTAAIAQASIAVQQAIAQAATAGPFPANLAAMAAVAAATAGLVSNIAAIGMAHDGIDSVPETGTWLLQKGERVTTAATSAKLDATLDRVNRDVSSTTNSSTVEQHFQINGNPDDRTIELIKRAAQEGARQGHQLAATDVATGKGPISRAMSAKTTVKRRVG